MTFKFKKNHNHRVIDKDFAQIISILNKKGIKTLGSCCGHGRYPPTIVADITGHRVEIFSGIEIPRKRKFYKKDKDGYYYIPETLKSNTDSPSSAESPPQ